ncbi:type 1 glutamine amidotransferase [Hymenobacter wooponensis]|uniref:Type 1 glutamine amidotransferase n=1 Tax=Hymenobacter wooponensis TaxID=1525360 RepID=A0A4Z0MS61_9BACT|nr:type 1 glutamine amidotransferase [Hymenobacter wooponensis]TGD82260.1 type 1 glutamine amidotransferase [Hymenobacter wooponensis]
MQIHCFQHMPDEGPGHIAAWATARGHTLIITSWDAPGVVPPDLTHADLLVVLGGAMGVHDEAEFPWLRKEKAAIKATLEAGVPVLGLCLGSQLVAQQLGGTVGRNAQPEVGFWPVQFTAEARQHPLFQHVPEFVPALHWHYDAFTLPPGAQLVAYSPPTSCQGFLWRERVVGLQFHPEADAAWLASIVEAEGHLLKPAAYVQTAEAIQAKAATVDTSPAFLYPLLDALLATVADGA